MREPTHVFALPSDPYSRTAFLHTTILLLQATPLPRKSHQCYQRLLVNYTHSGFCRWMTHLKGCCYDCCSNCGRDLMLPVGCRRAALSLLARKNSSWFRPVGKFINTSAIACEVSKSGQRRGHAIPYDRYCLTRVVPRRQRRALSTTHELGKLPRY